MINHRIITIPLAGIVATTLLASTASSANAFSVFIGGDYRLNSTPDNSRLSSTPKTNAANSNFLSNLINPSTENFEGFTRGEISSFPLNLGSAGTATFQGKGIIESVPTGTDNGFYPISGNQFLRIGSMTDYQGSPGAGYNTFNFSNPVAAIGFYGTGLFNIMTGTDLELTLTNGTIKRFQLPAGSNDLTTAFYAGVIAENSSEQFTQAKIVSENSRIRYLGLDDLTVASFNQVKSTPVPEPLTVLGSLAAAGLGFVFRRRYKQV